MKCRLAVLVAAAAAVLIMILIVPAASAQNAARATIPFAFTANHQQLPAGCYQVSLESRSRLVLKNCDTGKPVILMVRSTKADRTVTQSSLQFYNSGHRFWLMNVRFTYTNAESSLTAQPKPELELAVKPVNHTIEVAMK
jgi:hypothetical protein